MQFESIEEAGAFMKKAGLPNFQEYAAMTPEARKKLRGPENNLLTQIYNNIQSLGKVRAYHFQFLDARGRLFKFKDRMFDMLNAIADEGYDFNQMKCTPELREDHSTGLIMEITVSPKVSAGGIIL